MLALCQDQSHTLILSVASVWEMQIKSQLGKLNLDRPLSDIIESQQLINNLELLPVQLAHVLALQYLLPHHKDPFDRLIIAQALVEGMPVISVDATFPLYPVTVLG
ncbi:MAG TPA: type II toxin-antitoxin system VapC family toxin [Herpetosiphonaceae bacterium]